MQITGDMLYNGSKQSEFNVTRTARYVDQVDLHNPALTVRETLTFSAMCQGPGYHRSARLAPAATDVCPLRLMSCRVLARPAPCDQKEAKGLYVCAQACSSC